MYEVVWECEDGYYEKGYDEIAGEAAFDLHLLLSRSSSALHEFFIGWLFSAANCSLQIRKKTHRWPTQEILQLWTASSGSAVTS